MAAARTTQPDRLRPRLYTCRGVEVFPVGEQRGKPYTPADLADIVRNFARFSAGDDPHAPCPAAIGHEEDQVLLKNTGLPGVGRIKRLWTEGGLLLADVGDIPQTVARLINGRAYRKVSAEIYPQPPPGVPGRGKMLRRVVFLGGELPHVKGLADLPLADYEPEDVGPDEPARQAALTFCEAREPAGEQTWWTVFSEVRPMPESTEMQRGGPLTPIEYSEDDVAGMDDQAVERFAQMVRRYAEMGRKCHGDKFSCHFNDTEAVNVMTTPAKPISPEQYSEAMKQAVAEIKAEIKASMGDHARSVDTLTVESFCESRSRQGKIPPCELDASSGKPTLRDVLLALDNSATVLKFSENGQEVSKTSRQLLMDQIDARPARLFGERFKDPHGSSNADVEVAKVEQHWEAFSEDFTRLDTPKSELVEGYQAARKLRPGLTAEQYLNI